MNILWTLQIIRKMYKFNKHFYPKEHKVLREIQTCFLLICSQVLKPLIYTLTPDENLADVRWISYDLQHTHLVNVRIHIIA